MLPERRLRSSKKHGGFGGVASLSIVHQFKVHDKFQGNKGPFDQGLQAGDLGTECDCNLTIALRARPQGKACI
jgi:hypothetical protein